MSVKHALESAALAIVVATAGAFAGAGQAQAKCTTDAATHKGWTGDDYTNTQAQTFVDVNKSKVRFTQGGKKAGCIVVRFSAVAKADSSSLMFIRMVMDGNILSPVTTVQFSQDSNNSPTARAFEVVFPKVSPGKHNVKIQMMINSSANGIIAAHTVSVHHKK